MGEKEVSQFLSALAVAKKVSASPQNQALCGLLFLSRPVLSQNMGWLDEGVRAKRPQRLPVVLPRPAGRTVLEAREGVHWIMANLLSGSGLRLLACLRLRGKDLDVAQPQLLIRAGKGNKDRITLVPAVVEAPLKPPL